jgi:WS/DGAT/MGAT family acyltransferase
MARFSYDRLTALDSSFLVLEKPNAYMHVASTQIHEAGPLETAAGGIDADAIRELTAASLHEIPRYRQKLSYVPLENHPVWVDDDRFNLDYHIRHTSLPKPGTEEQLKRLSARIMQQHLDRARPLWEMWIVEGLERGRFALITKIHHSMTDGVSGVDLIRILMSATPDQPRSESPQYIPRPAPSRFELLCDEFLWRASLPWKALRDIRSFFREAEDARREMGVRVRAVRETLGATLRFASATPLNLPIGPHRRFDWLTMELAAIKDVRKKLSGTVNDVVLTVVTGAVRRFLQRRRVDPRSVEFRVMAPVSVRTESEHGAFGNRVSVWMVDLPIGEPDPRTQLKSIAKRTAELKNSKQAIGAEVLTQAAEWTPSMLLALGARNVTRLLAFNMVVTNIPGPQIPMYMAGARMLEVYPHVPLVDNLGLGIALLSYDGKLCWGFNADYDLVPDLPDFVEAVRQSFQELRKVTREIALPGEDPVPEA